MIQSILSGEKAVNFNTSSLYPGRPCFKSSILILKLKLALLTTMLSTLSALITCPLWAVIIKINMTTFCVNLSMPSFRAGYHCLLFNNFMTKLMSHIQEYLGWGGWVLKTPLINWQTKGWSPNFSPLGKTITLLSADLAVHMALYPLVQVPSESSSWRKAKASERGGLK